MPLGAIRSVSLGRLLTIAIVMVSIWSTVSKSRTLYRAR